MASDWGPQQFADPAGANYATARARDRGSRRRSRSGRPRGSGRSPAKPCSTRAVGTGPIEGIAIFRARPYKDGVALPKFRFHSTVDSASGQSRRFVRRPDAAFSGRRRGPARVPVPFTSTRETRVPPLAATASYVSGIVGEFCEWPIFVTSRLAICH